MAYTDEQLTAEERAKKTLSIVTDDFGHADVQFLMDLPFPCMVIIEDTDKASLAKDEDGITKRECEDLDDIKDVFKSIPEQCKVRIPSGGAVMVLESRMQS